MGCVRREGRRETAGGVCAVCSGAIAELRIALDYFFTPRLTTS